MNKPAQLELVGRKIRQLRRQRKLTQVELAEKIGIHQSDLSSGGLAALALVVGALHVAVAIAATRALALSRRLPVRA